MVRRIEENTVEFPSEFYKGYWHLYLPVAQDFIDSSNTPRNVKRLGIQTLIDKVKYLVNVKPDSKETLRVVACITSPHLHDSQIIYRCGMFLNWCLFSQKGKNGCTYNLRLTQIRWVKRITNHEKLPVDQILHNLL